MAKNDKFVWGKGDVEIILPNGKKLEPKKPAKPAKKTDKKKSNG
jgi:hypothetical protein